MLEPSTDVEGVVVEGKVSKTKQNVKYKLLFREWGGQKMKYVHGTLQIMIDAFPNLCQEGPKLSDKTG